MKAADIRRVAEEHVLALLPGEAVQVGGRVVLPPVEFLLRAFVFESSTSSRSDFHVHALVEPLYAPEQQAAGTARTLSPRLVYEDGLDGGQAGELRHWLQSEALPLLERIRKPSQLADEIKRRERGFPFNGQKEETRGYSLILAGREGEAEKALRQVVEHFERGADTLDYEREALDRARAMLDRLGSGRREAVEVMYEWRRENAARIGISGLLAPGTE